MALFQRLNWISQRHLLRQSIATRIRCDVCSIILKEQPSIKRNNMKSVK